MAETSEKIRETREMRIEGAESLMGGDPLDATMIRVLSLLQDLDERAAYSALVYGAPLDLLMSSCLRFTPRPRDRPYWPLALSSPCPLPAGPAAPLRAGLRWPRLAPWAGPGFGPLKGIDLPHRPAKWLDVRIRLEFKNSTRPPATWRSRLPSRATPAGLHDNLKAHP
eukprot:gene30918-35971_t